MNRSTMNRLLEKSPAESLAALSASAFFRGEALEHERIYAALPGHGRSSRHEFFIQHHALTEALLLLAVEYWKTVATVRTCVVGSLAAEDEMRPISEFLANAYGAKQVSLEEALRQICAQTGISFEDVAAFVEIEPRPESKPIPKLVDEYVEMFGMPSTRGKK